MWKTVFIPLLLPVIAAAQGIGHPGGRLLELQVEKDSSHRSGCSGFEVGFMREWNLEADYHHGPRNTDAELEQSYGGLLAVVEPVRNLEFDVAVGINAQDIADETLDQDSLDDGYGLQLGLGARWGFSPLRHVRLGIGGQVKGSYSANLFKSNLLKDGEDLLFHDGRYSDNKTIELLLLQGRVFGGGGVDIPLSEKVILAPYAGGGIGLMRGRANLIRDYLDLFDSEHRKLGWVREDRPGFFFGGMDVHIIPTSPKRAARIGLEGQTTGKGWFVGVSVQIDERL